MTKKSERYTLWTIPKSEWSHPMRGVTLDDQDQRELIAFAKRLEDERLSDRLRPFDSPVTQDTLSKSVGRK